MTFGARAARVLVRLASLAAPAARRERMLREWDAELLAEGERGASGAELVRHACGAFADARALRAIEWRAGPPASPREA